jgi:hypothetical protein
MLRVLPCAVFSLVWSVGFANAQESSAWTRLPKLDLDKQIRIHIDKAVMRAEIEVTDWRWLRKNVTIAAKVTCKKGIPPGMRLSYWTYTKEGFALAGGPLVDATRVKVNEAAIGWIPVRATPDKTDRVFISLRPEKNPGNLAWVGLLKDPALEKEKPASGLVTSAAEFTRLWTAWFGKEKLPTIDFEKQVIIVTTSTRARIHGLHLIDNKGDVQVFVGLILGAPEECSYGLLAVDREGIKTIQGKPLSK